MKSCHVVQRQCQTLAGATGERHAILLSESSRPTTPQSVPRRAVAVSTSTLYHVRTCAAEIAAAGTPNLARNWGEMGAAESTCDRGYIALHFGPSEAPGVL